jgi:multiple sugar transport system permease protein
VLFVLIIATMMIPFQSILTPLFIILTKLGLNNTLFGLTLVYVTLQLPFSVFMMRNAFDAVPKEIEEAARIDGAGDLKLLVRCCCRWSCRGGDRRALCLPQCLERVPGGPDPDVQQREIHAAGADDGGARRPPRRGQLGRGAGRRHRHDDPLPDRLPALQRYYMRGLMAGAVK